MDTATTPRPPHPAADLTGQVAVVTGSTSGIGLAVARALAGAGASVVMNGRGAPDAVEPLRREIAGLCQGPSRAVYVRADVATAAEAVRLVTEAEATFGRVDILVNNAGVQHVAPIEAFPPDMWDRIIAINLTSAFHTIRTAVPGMKARRSGRIVNVASAHALVASPFKAAYVAAKHGLLGLTRTVALEVAEHGITVNAICPGYVLTPLVEKQIPDTAKARGLTEEQVVRTVLLAAQPTKRFVADAEIGALTVFLCGPAAASITGTALPVDGGWTAQ
jgi:3-hydroxybutyrate dehydrogenase